MPFLMTHTNRLLAGLGTLLIFLQMMLICSDITGRYLFNRPVQGVLEVIELSIVAIVFLHLPNAILTGRLVRSDALFAALTRSRPQLALLMNSAFCLVGAFVLWAITYGIWFRLLLAIQRNHFTGTPGIFTAPVWPALLCIVVGSAWGGLNFLLIALRITPEMTANNKDDDQ